jgi:hypothetical protein
VLLHLGLILVTGERPFRSELTDLGRAVLAAVIEAYGAEPDGAPAFHDRYQRKVQRESR